eukprot:1151854-Pelagomonas_calceolata.AAC.1
MVFFCHKDSKSSNNTEFGALGGLSVPGYGTSMQGACLKHMFFGGEVVKLWKSIVKPEYGISPGGGGCILGISKVGTGADLGAPEIDILPQITLTLQ